MDNTCPKCHRQTVGKKVCPYCGHEIAKEDSTLKTLLLVFIIIGCLIALSMAFVKFAGNPFSFLNKFSMGQGSKIYEVTKAPKDLPVSREPIESIGVDRVINLRKLLEDKQFEALNIELEGFQKSFEGDYRNEFKVYDAFRAFNVIYPDYEGLIKEWISYSPERFPPYLAMAQYYYNLAWESRGYKWAADTKSDQFEKMRMYFEKSEANIKFALNRNPRLFVAYQLLLGIRNASGAEEEEDQLIEKAIELFPYCFLVRYDYMWAKEPRWGGSYSIMEDFAKKSEELSNVNSRFTSLYGCIYYDQGIIFERNKEYEGAVALFTKAMSFGDHWSLYNKRASVYYFDLKEYDKALEDVNHAIMLRSVVNGNYLLRARIYFAKGEMEKSLEDLHMAMRLKPDDQDVKDWKKWAGQNLLSKGHKVFKEDLHYAIREYDSAIIFNDVDPEAYYWRGMAYYRLKEQNSAFQDFKKAIELNPRYFEAYRMIDYTLMVSKDWDAIIGYWNKFVGLEPNHAAAYFERSGAYYHKGDLESAKKDLKKSCDLGNQEACHRFSTLPK